MFPATDQRDLVRGTLETRPVHGAARSVGVRALTVRAGRALFALCTGATVLIGCPLYSDHCESRNDCASGFYCEQFSQRCRPVLDLPGCSRPDQCEVGETCTPDFVCRPGSCSYHGCVTGYRCGVVDSAHACVPVTSDAGPNAPNGEGPSDASVPADAGDAAAAPLDGGLDAGPDASLGG